MMKFSSIDEIVSYLKTHGCVTLSAGHIRELCGYGRLGSEVRLYISKLLEEKNIRHYPTEFPGSQYTLVRLVAQASPLDDVIEAVLTPTPKTDGMLNDIATRGKALDLNKVKEVLELFEELKNLMEQAEVAA